MFDFFGSPVFLLVGLHIFSSAAGECEKNCPQTERAVDANGKIVMTVWYDKDIPGDSYQADTDMVRKACQARDLFKDNFSVDFVIGSGSIVSRSTYNEQSLAKKANEYDQLVCKNICDLDRREGCAAMLLDASKYADFVCCSNNDDENVDCAANLDLDPMVLLECVLSRSSDQLLLNNAKRRNNAGIPYCRLPEYSLNNEVDNCKTATTFDDLKKVICEIFKRGDVSIAGC